MSRVQKIKELEAETRVLDLRSKGLGYRAIAKKVSDDTGEPVSHMAVQTYLASVPEQVESATEEYGRSLANDIAELKSQHDALIKDTIAWSETVLEQISQGTRDVLDYRVCLDELDKRLQGKAKFLSDLYVPNQPKASGELDIVKAVNTVKIAMDRVQKEKGSVAIS